MGIVRLLRCFHSTKEVSKVTSYFALQRRSRAVSIPLRKFPRSWWLFVLRSYDDEVSIPLRKFPRPRVVCRTSGYWPGFHSTKEVSKGPYPPIPYHPVWSVSIPLRKFPRRDPYFFIASCVIGFHSTKEVSKATLPYQGFRAGKVSIPLRKFPRAVRMRFHSWSCTLVSIPLRKFPR